MSEIKNGFLDRDSLTGVELCSKTLGIIGFGAIGKKVAKIARGFNMKILVNDLNKDNESAEYNHVDLSYLLQKADFISINCPLNESTKKMIDNCRNFNDFTKELLKLSAELQHEQNKSAILAKYQMMQAMEQQNKVNNNN